MKDISIPSLYTLHEQWIDLRNAIFVYPTDSIYWLWAYVNSANIQKIERIKDRHPNKHYSIIAPSFQWIIEHFDVDDTIEEYRTEMNQTYGPLTLLCSRRDKDFLPEVSTNWLVWIRIITHPFQDFVTMLGEPFLSTSANISGEPYNKEMLKEIFAQRADYYVTSDAPMSDQASTLINYTIRDIITR